MFSSPATAGLHSLGCRVGVPVGGCQREWGHTSSRYIELGDLPRRTYWIQRLKAHLSPRPSFRNRARELFPHLSSSGQSRRSLQVQRLPWTRLSLAASSVPATVCQRQSGCQESARTRQVPGRHSLGRAARRRSRPASPPGPRPPPPARPPRVPVCAQPGAAPSLRARRALRAARTAARAAARPPPWAGLSQNSPALGERPRAPPRAAGRRGERPEAGPPPASGSAEKAGVRGGPAATSAWPLAARPQPGQSPGGPSLAQAQVGAGESAA